MKKLSAILFCSILMFLSACSAPEEEAPAILDLLGKEKAEVEEVLQITDVEENKEFLEGLYSVETKIEGTEVTAHYEIYEDVFLGAIYIFPDVESGYNYSKTLRANLESTFGEKTTYPEITGTNFAYYDEIAEVTEIEDNVTYFESFTPVVDSPALDEIAGDIEYRVEVTFELIYNQDETCVVSVGYSIIPTNRTGLDG